MGPLEDQRVLLTVEICLQLFGHFWWWWLLKEKVYRFNIIFNYMYVNVMVYRPIEAKDIGSP